jgi:putative aminopeptidase FrvX
LCFIKYSLSFIDNPIIPRRYSHSPLELVKWPDVEKTAQLLYFFLKELDSKAIEELMIKV